MKQHARAAVLVVMTLALASAAPAVDLSQFTLLGQYSTGKWLWTVTVDGTTVYLPYTLVAATGADPEWHRLDILDASNPAAIGLLGSRTFSVPKPVEYYSMPVRMVVRDGLLYMSLHAGGFAIFDVSDPAHPRMLSHWAPPSPMWGDAMQGLLLDGFTLYVGWDWNHGLGVFDVSNPAAPVKLGETGPLGGFARDVAKKDHYVFVTTYYGGSIRIIDVANPAAPIVVGSIPTPGDAYWLGGISGNLLFVADGWDWYGLKIFDVSIPLAPVLVGSYPTAGLGYGRLYTMNLAGSQVLASFVDYGPRIVSFDVSNPAAPVLQRTLAVAPPGSMIGLFAFTQDRLYIPRTDGYLDIWGPRGVTVLDDFNRADGELGANWTGFNDGLHYLISGNTGQAWYGGPIYWSAGEAFGAVQQAFVTFTSFGPPPGLDNGLLLKVQSDPVPANMSGAPDWIKGCIGVSYDAAAQSVHVATWRPGAQAWSTYPSQPLALAAGDTFGAQALADGVIRVLRNGVPVAAFTLDAADQAFFNSRGGRIGLWFEQAAVARFDDFGGGTLVH